MDTQIRGLEQGTANTRDMQNLVNTADGGLNTLGESLGRIRELSIQAANGTQTEASRNAIQQEIAQLADHIEATTAGLEFNTRNLLDGSANTKYLSERRVPTAANPIRIQFEFITPQPPGNYRFMTGNDAPERDPNSWTLSASNDGSNWTVVDTRTNVALPNGRGSWQTFNYTGTNTTPYRFYRIDITRNRNNIDLTQISCIELSGASYTTGNTDPHSNLLVEVSNGPPNVFVTGGGNNIANRGWRGFRALGVYGELTQSNAFDYQVIYDNLNIAVTADTELSYMIFPDYIGGYDFDFTSMFMAVDLEFDDGTFLSQLNALDQNRTRISPLAQGRSRVLQTRQWNHIYGNIGTVAEGRTITRILIGFENPNGVVGKRFAAHFDDIKISEVPKSFYERENLAEYVNILRGTNDSSAFSRGLTSPSVVVPHGFNFWSPSTNIDMNTNYNYQLTPGATFKHIQISHIPSTWVGDRGTFSFMANTISHRYKFYHPCHGKRERRGVYTRKRNCTSSLLRRNL
jgi:flagellin-like hook-associated protein FlgL